MTKAILIIAIMNLLLSFCILVALANFVAETWKRIKEQTDEFDKSLVEFVNFMLNIKEVRKKVAEAFKNGEREVDLTEVLK